MPLTRQTSSSSISAAGFGTEPRAISSLDFGASLPYLTRFGGLREAVAGLQALLYTSAENDAHVRRQLVLLETLVALEDAAPTARYHRLAQQNLKRWAAAAPPPTASGRCAVHVLPGDWGAVTLEMTRRYGATFASLNMANAFGPGGGYTHGMVAQEENMFRRTDCHFSLDRADLDVEAVEYPQRHRPMDYEYKAHMTRLLEAGDGRVYLDTERPRVCVRGPEDRRAADLGYAWLADTEVFPFLELRAAAVDLRGHGSHAFDDAETARRIGAQLDTLIEKGVRHAVLSAFGCGAFMNPAERVAAAYRAELEKRATHFDVIAFGIFHAGYGPNNYAPFEAAFEGWGGGGA